MGNPQSKSEERLRSITREITSLRSSLRTSRQNISKAKKDTIISTLALRSSEVTSFNGQVKRKYLDAILRLISETMEDILQIDPVLDASAIDSDSFVAIPIKERRTNSAGSLRSAKTTSGVPSLRMIEAKYEELKGQVQTAINNKDGRQLRLHLTTLKVLVEDLEMVHAERDTPLEERKQDLVKKLVVLYRIVNKYLKSSNKIVDPDLVDRKQQALKNLEDIEVQLAENQSLLDKLLKNKNSGEFAKVKSAFDQCYHKLSLVEVVDSEIKKKYTLMSHKLTEITRELDQVMAKREFNSKFSINLDTYERLVRNIDPTSDTKETIKKLEEVRNSVQNLEELNDTTRNRKRDLLHNINQKLEQFQQTDAAIVQQIVEDTVELRRKDQEHTVIDQFSSYWNNVRGNFDVNAYTNWTLLRIDNVLESMEHSIHDLRLGIADKCDTKHLLRQSQSFPRLNQIDGPIKTRARMSHISTPELVSSVKTRQSVVQEVKVQVNYIKEKIGGGHNRALLRQKLEKLRSQVEHLVADPNPNIATQASLVNEDIGHLYYNLILDEYQERVFGLIKRVDKFNLPIYDPEYDSVKQQLVRVQIDLENLQLPEQYQESKNKLLDEIGNSLEQLQNKNQSYKKEDVNVKAIKARLQNLSDTVRRFSGTHKGVHYNTIERELFKLQVELGALEDSEEMQTETERLLKILEERASVAQSFNKHSEEPTSMSKVKRDLHNIKQVINATPDNDVDAFIGLQSRLDLVTLELSQINARSNENLAREKEFFINEAETLKNGVDAKVALGQKPMSQWPKRDVTTHTINKDIELFETSFNKLKQEIRAPVNEEDVHKFYKLTQDIKALMEQLQALQYNRDTNLHQRKINLLNEMRVYVDGLEKGAMDADYVIKIERQVDELSSLLETTPQNIKLMATELQALQTKLQDHKFTIANEVLHNRKTSVIQKADDLVHKLREREDQDKKLDQIEEQLSSLTGQVASFVGVKSQNRYYELNESITRLMVQLDRLESSCDKLQKRRLKLLKDLHSLGRILDERAKQTQDVDDLEQELNEMEKKIEQGGDGQEVKRIKNDLDQIGKRLTGLKINNELIPRKDACMDKINTLANKAATMTPIWSSPNSILYSFVTKKLSKNTNLDEFVKKIDAIEMSVNECNNINQLYELEENLDQCISDIRNLNIPKDSPEYTHVRNLSKKIQKVFDDIIKKTNNYDKIQSIDAEVDQIAQQLKGSLTDEQINAIDERLIQLHITLGQMQQQKIGFKGEMDACIMRIIMFIHRISEYKASVKNTSV